MAEVPDVITHYYLPHLDDTFEHYLEVQVWSDSALDQVSHYETRMTSRGRSSAPRSASSLRPTLPPAR